MYIFISLIIFISVNIVEV